MVAQWENVVGGGENGNFNVNINILPLNGYIYRDGRKM